MLILNQKKLIFHLKKDLKIESNAIVWLHLSIKGLGLIKNLDIITNSFKSVLKKGVLVIPAFTYSWAKKKLFRKSSLVEKDLGIYPNYIIKNKNFFRTNNPNFSSLILSKSKKWDDNFFKKNINNSSCFGKNSIFEVLHNLSKKIPCYIILLGGAHDDVVFRSTFLHYVEELVGVKYRYLKRFYEPITKRRYVEQYVRYLSNHEYYSINKKKPRRKYPVNEKYKILGKDLIKKNIIRFKKINYSETRIVKLNEFIEFVKNKLVKDKDYFLK